MRVLRIKAETFETALVPWPPRDMAVQFRSAADSIPQDYALAERNFIAMKKEKARAEMQHFEDSPQYGVAADDLRQLKPNGESLTIPLALVTYGRQEIHLRLNNDTLVDGSFPNVLAITEGIVTGDNKFAYVQRGAAAAYYNKGQLHALVSGHAPPGELPAPEDLSLDWWIAHREHSEMGFESREIADRQFLGLVFDRAGYKPEIVLTAATSLTLDEIKERHEDAVDKYNVRRGGIFTAPVSVEGLISKVIGPYHGKEKHVPPGLAHAVLEAANLGGLRALEQINTELRTHGAPVLEYFLQER